MRKLFNRKFKHDKEYVFSFNAFIMSEGLDPSDEGVRWLKGYDGFPVYPDHHDLKINRRQLDGIIIRPEWCVVDRGVKRKYANKKQGKRVNRYPRQRTL